MSLGELVSISLKYEALLQMSRHLPFTILQLNLSMVYLIHHLLEGNVETINFMHMNRVLLLVLKDLLGNL